MTTFEWSQEWSQEWSSYTGLTVYIPIYSPFLTFKCLTRLTAESILKLINNTRTKIFGNLIFEMKVVPYYGLFLNTICILRKLRMCFNDFFNLILLCKDIESRYGRTRARSFFSIVRVDSLTI